MFRVINISEIRSAKQKRFKFRDMPWLIAADLRKGYLLVKPNSLRGVWFASLGRQHFLCDILRRETLMKLRRIASMVLAANLSSTALAEPNLLYDILMQDVLINADYWTTKPQILGASLGFTRASTASKSTRDENKDGIGNKKMGHFAKY
jgi:hypothetical protein